MSFNLKSKHDPETFYDTVEGQVDPLHFKQRKGAQNRCGVDLDMTVPKEGEVRLIGNRNRQCAYYMVGVDVCHTQML